jgi:hypothetical protein
MRLTFFALVLLSQVPAQAPPQNAGERYKSIQVLKDIPAADVIPTMSVIAGSLGVTCSHCRTPPVSGEFEATATFPGSGKVDTAFSYPPEAEGEMVYSFVRPLRIRELYPKLDVTSRTRIDGKDAIVVMGTTTRGAVHTLFFDEASGLLLRRYSERPTTLGPLPEEFDFDDYRDVNGIKVPHVTRWSRADYRVTFVVESVR